MAQPTDSNNGSGGNYAQPERRHHPGNLNTARAHTMDHHYDRALTTLDTLPPRFDPEKPETCSEYMRWCQIKGEALLAQFPEVPVEEAINWLQTGLDAMDPRFLNGGTRSGPFICRTMLLASLTEAQRLASQTITDERIDELDLLLEEIDKRTTSENGSKYKISKPRDYGLPKEDEEDDKPSRYSKDPRFLALKFAIYRTVGIVLTANEDTADEAQQRLEESELARKHFNAVLQEQGLRGLKYTRIHEEANRDMNRPGELLCTLFPSPESSGFARNTAHPPGYLH